MAALAAVDTNGAPFKTLVADLIAHHVALTSTLTVFETFTPGTPEPPGLDVLDPILKDQFEKFRDAVQGKKESIYVGLFAKERAMERLFARAGGLVIAGTDPTGGGGVIPGYSDQRQIELLVESGFTPLEAIKICTLNGATYLGQSQTDRLRRRRQAGGSHGRERQSGGEDLRHPERRDGLQAGRRLRPGEAHRLGEGESRAVLALTSPFTGPRGLRASLAGG